MFRPPQIVNIPLANIARRTGLTRWDGLSVGSSRMTQVRAFGLIGSVPRACAFPAHRAPLSTPWGRR